MTGELDRLRAALRLADRYYQAQLARRDAEVALAYLRSRAIPRALARGSPWQLGYAPPGRFALTRHLVAHGFTGDELVDAGLALVPAGGRLAGQTIDAFRNRLMFPVRDRTGGTVAFVGRDLSGNPRVPRYRNTRTTPLYTKSDHLYGFFEARARAGAAILLVEGPADVVAVSRLALPLAAVSTCGSALTGGQVALLRDSVAAGTPVIVCFDPDAPGRHATERAYFLLAGWPGPVDAVALPSGVDPAGLVASRGPVSAARVLTENRQPLLATLVGQRVAGHRLDEIEGRVAALRAAGRLLRKVADQIPRDELLLPAIGRQLGLRLGFDGVTVLESIYPPPRSES